VPVGKRDGDARLEATCARALAAGGRSYRHVDSILRRGLDRAPLPTSADEPARSLTSPPHENVRGPNHYN
jgi:hypothetical protein